MIEKKEGLGEKLRDKNRISLEMLKGKKGGMRRTQNRV